MGVVALATAVLIWLGPVASEAVTPVDPKKIPTLPCLNKAGDKYRAQVAPSRCAHFGPNGTFGGGVDLKGVEWDDWGGKTASGRGTECGFDIDCTDIAVDLAAYRVRKRCGRPIYTRLRATSNIGTTVVRTRACLGPA
jgi:hypothetical protein